MITTLTVVHAVISALLILFVLLHFGKGAEAGLFTDTSSSSILPQKGNVLNKITTVLTVIFLSLSLTLAILRSRDTVRSVFTSTATDNKSTTAASNSIQEKAPEKTTETQDDTSTEAAAPSF